MTQLELRTNTMLDIVEKENYSILFFQELIPFSFGIIEKRLISKYVKVLGKEINLSRIDYFNATFLRRDHIIYDDHFTIPFPNSIMGRKLLVTRAHTGSVKLALLNTHLESCKESSEERKNQLKTCFGLCPSFPEQYNIIFGGDLNLRDAEVGSRKPRDMFDVWEAFDGNENVRFTWDLARNTNKHMGNNVKPRARFDRFYFRNSEPIQLNFEYFGLTGLNKISGTQLFPSDHWGIVSRFRLEPEARIPLATKPNSSRPSLLSKLLKEKDLSSASSPPSKKTRKDNSPTQESCQQQ